MKQQPLTSAQSALIQRLRAAGYNSYADAATDAWSHLERVNLPSGLIGENDLRAEFDRLNQQADSR
jgi:hypothetical protein